MPATCPNCEGPRIRQFGTGTEKVEAEVQALFPGVRTLRWDYETTRKKGAHAAILGHFAAQHADVLVGTQMLAKGLDLPLVTLVGVVLADVGLNLPDYRAGERTFQVLTQVAGRAGRSPLGGEVILQTFQPEHYVIQAAAAARLWQAFYARELAYRRELGYPPFAQLVRLEYRAYDPLKAEQAAESLAAQAPGLDRGGRPPPDAPDRSGAVFLRPHRRSVPLADRPGRPRPGLLAARAPPGRVAPGGKPAKFAIILLNWRSDRVK